MLARVIRLPSAVRCFATSSPRSFLFFGKKETKTQQEIVNNQDKFEIDPEAAITILNKDNSPEFTPFNPETDMPLFKVEQWKHTSVQPRDIEATYTPELVATVVNEVFQELTTKPLTADQYDTTDLHDLQFRFAFAKRLQQLLGFDLNDYTLLQTHTVGQLYNELCAVISKRWVSERKPQAIVLRPEDFTADNVYLNQEATAKQQDKKLAALIEEARRAND